ncbi:hypothetical protein [Elioraea sp. Yellowstone]|uniref:hypothetical protein n=1 Tax=Elioraea sp. Yellowstone TaxID=2592070 RepID=UPI00138747EB|nr:hypothetical protein [Elioraea sp. Yellowstone]
MLEEFDELLLLEFEDELLEEFEELLLDELDELLLDELLLLFELELPTNCSTLVSVWPRSTGLRRASAVPAATIAAPAAVRMVILRIGNVLLADRAPLTRGEASGSGRTPGAARYSPHTRSTRV